MGGDGASGMGGDRRCEVECERGTEMGIDGVWHGNEVKWEDGRTWR